MQDEKASIESIRHAIINYIITDHPSTYSAATLPLDQSMVELGILDSYGVVELVTFLEKNWSMTIADSEITREKMGSINKMTNFVLEKLNISQG